MPSSRVLCRAVMLGALYLCGCSSDPGPASDATQTQSGTSPAAPSSPSHSGHQSSGGAAAPAANGPSANGKAGAGAVRPTNTGTSTPSAAANGGGGGNASSQPSAADPSADQPAVAGMAAATSGGAGTAAAPASGGSLMGSCPDGFTPKSGMNTDFASGGKMRSFHVSQPMNSEGPSPMFVALTGTVQEELSFVMQAGLSGLPAQGWIVVSPIRSCSQEGRNCSTTGMDGRVWEPWFDGTAPRSDEAGPDVEFVEAMVRCVSTMWPVAADKIYTGGISAGGSFSNRNMTFNSKLFAGGVPASGNWTYGVPPATTMEMDPSIVIIIWGGPNDTWPGSPPYAEETKAAADYYAAQPNVVTVACSGTHGHAWPAGATPWIIETLLSHPKGSDKAKFTLKPPGGGLTCVLGPYTDH